MNKTIRRHATSPQETIDAFRRHRGIERRVHFETGGSPAAWRGVRQVIPDYQKEDSRLSCRGTYAMDEDEASAHFGPDDDWGDHLGEE